MQLTSEDYDNLFNALARELPSYIERKGGVRTSVSTLSVHELLDLCQVYRHGTFVISYRTEYRVNVADLREHYPSETNGKTDEQVAEDFLANSSFDDWQRHGTLLDESEELNFEWD